MRNFMLLVMWSALAFLAPSPASGQKAGVLPDTLPRHISERPYAWEYYMLWAEAHNDTLAYPTEYWGEDYGLPTGRKTMWHLGTAPDREHSSLGYNYLHGVTFPDSGAVTICADPTRTGNFDQAGTVSFVLAYFTNNEPVGNEPMTLRIHVKYPTSGVGCALTRFAYPKWEMKRVALIIRLLSQFFLTEVENPPGPEWSRIWIDMTSMFQDVGVITSSETVDRPTPFTLSPPYPNPATSGQDVRMRIAGLAGGRELTASVYDVLGREMARIDRVLGDEVRFSTSGWASGMYIIKLFGAATAANDYAHAVQRLVVR